MQVIAQRDKKLAYIGLIFPLVLLILTVLSWTALPLWGKIVLSALTVFFFIVFGYFALLPKDAIAHGDDVITLNLLFRSKQISVKDLKYVSYHELGNWRARSDRNLLANLYILRNDIRTLTVTFTENGVQRHCYVVAVKDCSAVAISINALLDNQH